MAIFLPYNEKYGLFTDACYHVFIVDGTKVRNGITHYDPAFISKTSGCCCKHVYNGLDRLNKIGVIKYHGDQVYYESYANMYNKDNGGFVCPDVVATSRFLKGTTLSEKRLAISLFKRGIADGRRKPWKRTFKISTSKLIEETGAQCKSRLLKMFKHLDWLFEYTLIDNNIKVKIVPEYLVFSKRSCVASVDIVEKLLKRFKLVGKLDSIVVLKYWHLFGGFVLYEGLKRFRKYIKIVNFSAEGYLYKILKNIRYDNNKNLCCG